MTNTAKKISPYRHMLTSSEAATIHGGALDVCTHPRHYRTGNYKKTKIEFFWWVSLESYCPDCGLRFWNSHIEF